MFFFVINVCTVWGIFQFCGPLSQKNKMFFWNSAWSLCTSIVKRYLYPPCPKWGNLAISRVGFFFSNSKLYGSFHMNKNKKIPFLIISINFSDQLYLIRTQAKRIWLKLSETAILCFINKNRKHRQLFLNTRLLKITDSIDFDQIRVKCEDLSTRILVQILLFSKNLQNQNRFRKFDNFELSIFFHQRL